ncbi:MAG TPA: urease accessory protein UreD [Stellaceae bacterium]|nr:urease accessory protein UreD [Stellaceae bacterium]
MAAPAASAASPGIAEIRFASDAGTTRLAHLHQRAPLRVLFPAPEPGDGAIAVLITTSGGMVAGDRIAISLQSDPGAVALVTTSAAEKIYRSTGATTEIVQSVSVGAGAWMEYLPQETILFDGARLRRRTTVALAPGAGFLGGGIIVFGRRARGERFTQGLLHDELEVRRDGAPWGDALHLDGDIAALIAHPACFDGAAACATLLLAPPDGDPTRFVMSARAVQPASPAAGWRGGVTAVRGLAVARWLAADPLPLRREFAELACHWRREAAGLPARLPRLWQT